MKEGFGLGDIYGFGKSLDGAGLGKPLAKEGSNLQAEAEGWDDRYVTLGGV